MKSRILVAASLAAGALLGIASTAQAVPAIVAGTGPGEVIVQTAPPAPIYEAVPAPRAGYIWAPGAYEWRGDRYAWVGGHWIETRPGYAWEEAHWVQRPDGSWRLMGGHWVRSDGYAYYRDRDGDGVPNRYDAYPNDPYRH
jgi:hypothetical protein